MQTSAVEELEQLSRDYCSRVLLLRDMALYILCIFLLYVSDCSVRSVVVLNQKETAIGQPGKSVQLECEVSGYNINDHHLHWIRQSPGSAHMEWIVGFRTGYTTYIHDSFKNRVTPSSSGSTGRLKIDQLVKSDTATYYCARGYYDYFDIWGPGVMVTVTSVQLLIPAVYPVVAVGHTGSSSTTIACVVHRFWPQPLSVTWETTKGERLSEVKDINFPLSGDPPAYNLLSQVSINNQDWNSKTYQCNVNFHSTSIVKIISKVCVPQEPSVLLLQGTCPEGNGDIKLTCQVYNLTSQEATLKWYINNEERRFAEDKLELGKSQNHYFALHSTVTIGQSEWNNGVQVKCQVTDTYTGKTAEDTIKKCSDSFNCLGIDVFIVPPSIEELYVHNTARIACVASNLKDTDANYSFVWSFPGGSNLDVQSEDSQLHNNGSYSVSRVLIVSPELWLEETEFTCVFHHDSLQTPIITRLKKEKVTKTSQPVVSLFPPSSEELALKETYTLLCLSSKVNPPSIFMGWMENDLQVSKHLYVNSEPMLETGGKTYFMISKLTIPASSWDSGFSYDCVVGHETIPKNFIRTSIDKSSGKPAKVTVSVKMSDATLNCY